MSHVKKKSQVGQIQLPCEQSQTEDSISFVNIHVASGVCLCVNADMLAKGDICFPGGGGRLS